MSGFWAEKMKIEKNRNQIRSCKLMVSLLFRKWLWFADCTESIVRYSLARNFSKNIISPLRTFRRGENEVLLFLTIFFISTASQSIVWLIELYILFEDEEYGLFSPIPISWEIPATEKANIPKIASNRVKAMAKQGCFCPDFWTMPWFYHMNIIITSGGWQVL